MSQPQVKEQVDWKALTRDFFANNTRGQALLIGETRKQVARELRALLDVRYRLHVSDRGIVREIEDFIYAELRSR